MEDNNGDAGSTAINITYETIFELLRREKNRDELQKLNENFYIDIKKYIEEKNSTLSPNSSSNPSFSEKEKTTKQISNTKKMITELFERREKKIIILALNKVRTESALTDTSAMLNDEKDFFHKLTETFHEYRTYILSKMLSEKETLRSHIAHMQKPSLTEENENRGIENKEIIKPPDEHKKDTNKLTKTIKILSQIPKFMGKELEVYGPFNPEDMASLPAEIADILIKKGRAEEVDSE